MVSISTLLGAALAVPLLTATALPTRTDFLLCYGDVACSRELAARDQPQPTAPAAMCPPGPYKPSKCEAPPFDPHPEPPSAFPPGPYKPSKREARGPSFQMDYGEQEYHKRAAEAFDPQPEPRIKREAEAFDPHPEPPNAFPPGPYKPSKREARGPSFQMDYGEQEYHKRSDASTDLTSPIPTDSRNSYLSPAAST